ncbi:MAG: hypothetical protein DWI02_03220 [Planctomycetota bacterium]|nr:MAG: hypothetical protein DWI02_03220 [Planctomycetota bacterium]
MKNERIVPATHQGRNEILPILPPYTIEKQAGFRTMHKPFGRSAEIHSSIFAATLNLVWRWICRCDRFPAAASRIESPRVG